MKIEDVKHKRFIVTEHLYDNGEFGIAIGAWDGTPNVIGMRWTGGNDTDDRGYPKLFNHPVWFIIHDDLKNDVLKALLGKEHSKPTGIKMAIMSMIER